MNRIMAVISALVLSGAASAAISPSEILGLSYISNGTGTSKQLSTSQFIETGGAGSRLKVAATISGTFSVSSLERNTLSGGSSFTAGTTPTGVLLSTMKGSITTVQDIEVTMVGMTATATGQVGIGSYSSLAQGVGRGFKIYFPARLPNLNITALTTTSVYVVCTDANVTAVVHLLGK